MAMKPLTTEQKQALGALRASLGGVSEEKRNAQKHLLAARKAILKMLEKQPATIPQIAEDWIRDRTHMRFDCSDLALQSLRRKHLDRRCMARNIQSGIRHRGGERYDCSCRFNLGNASSSLSSGLRIARDAPWTTLAFQGQ